MRPTLTLLSTNCAMITKRNCNGCSVTTTWNYNKPLKNKCVVFLNQTELILLD